MRGTMQYNDSDDKIDDKIDGDDEDDSDDNKNYVRK